MDDLISRQDAIDAMTNTLWHYPNECYRNLNEYEFAKGLAELGLKSVPSAQPERKRMTNKEWIDFLSEQFSISRTSAREMLHGMMQWKKEDNFKKQFNRRWEE